MPVSASAPSRSARRGQVQDPGQRKQTILGFPPAEVAGRTAVESHLLATDNHLDNYQFSCLAIRTLHPDLLPVSPGVDCRPPAGNPVRDRRTANDCIGTYMYGPLAVLRGLKPDFAFFEARSLASPRASAPCGLGSKDGG
jgi:hypothetical protein